MSPPAVVKIEKKIRKGTFKVLVNQIAWERLQNGPIRYVNLFNMKSLPCCITGYSFWLRIEEFFESLLFRLAPPGKQSTTASILPQPSLFLEKREKLDVYGSRQSERAPLCVNLWLSVRLFVVWTRMKKHWAVFGSSEPFLQFFILQHFKKLEAARCCVCRSDLFSDTAYNL